MRVLVYIDRKEELRREIKLLGMFGFSQYFGLKSRVRFGTWTQYFEEYLIHSSNARVERMERDSPHLEER